MVRARTLLGRGGEGLLGHLLEELADAGEVPVVVEAGRVGGGEQVAVAGERVGAKRHVHRPGDDAVGVVKRLLVGS
jgi:hypothetical protein